MRTPVDRFILSELQSRGLGFAEEAGRRVMIRRLYFDLTGLPPDPDDVDAFVSDPGPFAYEKLIDRLIESVHYGERCATGRKRPPLRGHPRLRQRPAAPERLAGPGLRHPVVQWRQALGPASWRSSWPVTRCGRGLGRGHRHRVHRGRSVGSDRPRRGPETKLTTVAATTATTWWRRRRTRSLR